MAVLVCGNSSVSPVMRISMEWLCLHERCRGTLGWGQSNRVCNVIFDLEKVCTSHSMPLISDEAHNLVQSAKFTDRQIASVFFSRSCE